MRSSRFLWLLAVPTLLLTAGCNYIHFGRLETPINDATLANDNSNLRIEKKLLLEELSIARKEGAALRTALDHAGTASGPASEELVAKLNEATRELATLRAGYARLQSEREKLASPAAPSVDTTSGRMAVAEQAAALKSSMAETEEKLATSLRNFTQLQEENNRLRLAIDEAHTENARLSSKVDVLTTQNNEARSALAQLNSEFLAQKEARAQAEQASEALRAQLQAMAAQPAAATTATAPSLASARESSAGGAREIEATLQLAQPPAAAAPSTAMLSTSPEKLRAAAAKNSPPPAETPAAAPATTTTDASAPAATAAPEKPARTYIVRTGDTLEKIAEQFYGHREQWRVLYAANNAQLSGGRPLRPGMELEVPTE